MYDVLKTQFEETKQKLQDVENTIRRMTGRDPPAFSNAAPGNVKFRNNDIGGKGNVPMRKRNAPFIPRKDMVQEEEAAEGFDEDSPEEEDGVSPKKRPSMQSTIVSNVTDHRTRRAKMEEQKKDRRIFARNRRMFGVMLGTLQKFQSEETRRFKQAQMRAEIDKKLEDAAEQEKIQAKKEKDKLFVTRRHKQAQIRCLEKKLEIAEIHDVWDKNHKCLLNFVQTESEPKIMYAPSKHNSKSEKCLKDSRARITALIESSSERVRKELEEIDDLYRKSDDEAEMVAEEATDKENIGPPESSVLEDGGGDDHTVNSGVGENTVETNNEESLEQPPEGSLPPSVSTEETSNPSGYIVRTESMDVGDEKTEENDKERSDHEEFEPIYDE